MQGSFLLEAIICQFLSKETLIELQVLHLPFFYQINQYHLQGSHKLVLQTYNCKLNVEDKLEIQIIMKSMMSGLIITRKEELRHDTTGAAGKTTSSWSRLKDPRIVRVSRAFGGKDRHSKVYTVKGLRDRRVRLSVSTAIQLYDLQERLGLNQPSKVVDWLLHAAKNEIDELPPLQFPPGAAFPIMDPKHGLKNIGASWNYEALEGKCKDVVAQEDHQDCNWGNNHDSSSNSYVSNSMPPAYTNTFARIWDPLSHQPASRILLPHGGDWPNFNLMAPSGSQTHHDHLVYHQHGISNISTHSYFPNSQIEGKQLNLYTSNNNNESSTTSPTQPQVRQLHFNMMTANLIPSQNDHAS